jgi:hypothetical protein
MRELDEKDWIIARLTYALYEEGRNASNMDARRTVAWFGSARLLAAWAELAGSKDRPPKYSPYWHEGKWHL